MKKTLLLISSLFTLGTVAVISTSTLTSVQANTTKSFGATSSVDSIDSEVVILDKGEFDSPMLLDPYDYSLNSLGFNTGKLVFSYTSTSLVDLDETVEKYFNLKLPKEFNLISDKDGGEDLREAITASYKLPGQSDYKKLSGEAIDTSHKGQINFTLPTSAIIPTGEITNFRIQIDFGKILDSLKLGEDYDYTQQIPNASDGSYHLKGALSSSSHFKFLPEGAALGYTNGGKAIK